jgi:RimJ/RimL family protein N-acetyltransferase
VIHELKPTEYGSVRSLFWSLRYHLTSAAVLDGNSPGRVFVDDSARPRSAFTVSPEGCYLAGDPYNPAFNRALNQAVVLRRGLGEDVPVLFLVVDPERWRERLSGVLDPCRVVEVKRRHYVCGGLHYDWRAHLPAGYTLHRIDRSLLDCPQLTVPDHVTGWMENNWGSIDRFLRDGFGFATVSEGEVVSWSLSDCVSDDRCEIGIRTAPAHRRRGLAAVTAAAAAEHALARGFASVGWHCPDDNLGSISTAERVGFQRERDYSAYYAFLDE